MLLEGSCHCGSVSFSVESKTAYPYRRCYCTLCRKTSSGGDHNIGLMGERETLDVSGADNLTLYEVVNSEGITMHQYFCATCGSPMYVLLPDWPQWVYPRASAIDTPLPEPPEVFHVILGERANWAIPEEGENHFHFVDNTEESMEEWHRRLGVYGNG